MKTKLGLSIILVPLIFNFASNFSSAQNLQLGNIDLNFCNNGEIKSELDLISKAGEEVPICINFSNTAKNRMTINVDFLDANITQDTYKNRACNAADRPKEHFGNFMLDYDKILTISGNSTIQKIYKIKLPIGYKGLSHGCIAYNMVQTGKQAGQSMLNIVVRKVKFIDIYVGDTQIKSQIQIGPIKTIKNGKITNFQIGLKNIGNVTQNTIFSGTISNIFGYKEFFKFDKNTINIPPNKEIQIQTNNADLTLPVYKGFFTVNFEIINKPEFNFNIKENDTIPQEVILGGNFKISKTIFISNPYFIGILIIFLILIYLAFFKKRKKQTINIPIPDTPINNTPILNSEQSESAGSADRSRNNEITNQ